MNRNPLSKRIFTAARQANRHAATLGVMVATLATLASPVQAQAPYPNKPIRLIVPMAAGGPSDAVARALAKGLGAALGQEVVVDNRAGGNAGVGAAVVLGAPADGYALLFAVVSNVGLPLLSKVSPYKSFTEFSPIATVGGNTQCLVVHTSVPARTLAELAAHARTLAQPLQRGSSNPAEDMVAGQVAKALGIRFDRVPYKGAQQMMPDLLEGRVQVAATPPGASAPHVAAGRLRMLGCSAAARLPAMPDVPTLAESGVHTAPLVVAHIIAGPPGLPAELAERLSAEVRKVAHSADFKRDTERLQIIGPARTPAQTRELVLEAEAQYTQFVRETGTSID